jgi:hypothetical protein
LNNYRKGLVICTSILLSIGLLATCTPFFLSLSPGERNLSKLPSVDVRNLKEGETTEIFSGWYHVYVTKLSDTNNPYLVYAIPYQRGKYNLPEFGWHRAVLPCFNFVQETNFQCLDTYEKGSELVWWSYMKWDKTGKFIGEQKYRKSVPDLYMPDFKVVGSNVILFIN